MAVTSSRLMSSLFKVSPKSERLLGMFTKRGEDIPYAGGSFLMPIFWMKELEVQCLAKSLFTCCQVRITNMLAVYCFLQHKN